MNYSIIIFLFFIGFLIIGIFTFFFKKEFTKEDKIEENPYVTSSEYFNYIHKYHEKNHDNIQEKTRKILGTIPILFVVLKRNKKRVDNINHIIKKFHLKNYHIIDAIDYKDFIVNNDLINVEDFKNIWIGRNNIFLPEIACLLSHLKACYFAYTQNYKKVLICEDDVSFDILFDSRMTIDDLWDERPNKCEVLSLFSYYEKYKPTVRKKIFTDFVWGTVAYVICLESIKKYLLTIHNGFFIENTLYIDGSMYKNIASDNLLKEVLNCYSLKDSIILPINEELSSTIHDSFDDSHIKHSNVILKKIITKLANNLILLTDNKKHIDKYIENYPEHKIVLVSTKKKGFDYLYHNGGIFVWFDDYFENIPYNFENCIVSNYFMSCYTLSDTIHLVEKSGNNNLKYCLDCNVPNDYEFIAYPYQEQFCFIIPAYNVQDIVEKNLKSIFTQKNKNWRILYIDDNSQDKTIENAIQVIKKYKMEEKVQILKNDKNYGQIYSRYVGYTRAKPNEILIFLDGDDWLSQNKVLDILEEKYRNGCSTTMGSFKIFENGKINNSIKGNTGYSRDIIKTNSFYKYWPVQHLRTFRASIIQNIPYSFLYDWNGKFAKMSTDQIESFWALPQANGNIDVIQDCLYIYNQDNSKKYKNSYHRKDMEDYREKMNSYIKERYSALQKEKHQDKSVNE